MNATVEIHGASGCPFAWRVRIAASEKGVPFDFVAFDAEAMDPRVSHNPERRSPLLVRGDQTLRESLIISQYIDEAFAGRPLQPVDPWQRALTRFTIMELEGLIVTGKPGAQPSAGQLAKATATIDRVEGLLADGRDYIGGEQPSLADTAAWPFLTILDRRLGVKVSEERPHTEVYWARVKERPSFVETRPPWAKSAQL